MESKKLYQLLRFDRGLNYLELVDKNEDFVSMVQQAISCINFDITHFNSGTTKEFEENLLEYDEAYELFENGLSYTINNVVYSIISCDIVSPEYKDKIILVKDCELSDDDIKSIQLPFESESFFRGYMKRVCEVFGGSYRLIEPDKFDFEYQALKEEYQYIIHTKIQF